MTVVGAWARAVALDTDRFVATVGPVIDDPAVQQALSIRLTDRVMEGLQVEDRVSTALAGSDQGELPVSPALLAAPITDGIRNVLLKRTEQAISSDAFRNLWNTALTRAHSQAIALLRGESTNATIEGDAVYINLLPFINDALASLEDQLSEIFNRSIDIPTITEAQRRSRRSACSSSSSASICRTTSARSRSSSPTRLPAAQAAIATMDKVVYALVALTIILAIVAFVLSTRRLRTALWLGFGVAIGLIVVRRLALRLDDAIVARVTGETNQAAVGAVTNDVFQDLRNFTTLMLVAAILIGVGAYLAGRPPWLTRTLERASDGTLVPRDAGWIRWIGEHALVLRVVAVVLGALVLFFANLGWMSLLVVMALVAATWFVLTYLHDRVTGQADVATG